MAITPTVTVRYDTVLSVNQYLYSANEGSGILNLIRYSLIAATITLVPWVIYLTPWQATLVSWGPWAPWVTVLATALSPLIAVQVTRKLDKDTERRRERVAIFQNLMAYRKAQLESLDFCRALSLVDVVFSGTSKAEVLVLDSLTAYHTEIAKNLRILTREQLNAMSGNEVNMVDERNRAQLTARTETLSALLHSIAECLEMKISHQSIASNGVWPDWVGKQMAAHRDGAQANIDMANFVAQMSAQRESPPATVTNQSSAPATPLASE